VAAALAGGDDVEFPFGSLKRVHLPHKKQHGRLRGRVTTIYKKPFTVALEVGAPELRSTQYPHKESTQTRDAPEDPKIRFSATVRSGIL
jgi:hypothetical protein